MTSTTERGFEMQIDEIQFRDIPTDVLIVPIAAMVSEGNALKRIVEKNTAYFFLEPDEMKLLKQATLNSIPPESDFDFVVGVWTRNDSQIIIASIYQIADEVEYLDSLPMNQNCHIGAVIENFDHTKSFL